MMRCGLGVTLLAAALCITEAVIHEMKPKDLWHQYAAQYPFADAVGMLQQWQWTDVAGPGTSGRYFVDETRSAFMKVAEKYSDYDCIRRDAFVLSVLEKLGIPWSPRLLWTNNRDRIVTTWSGTPVFSATNVPWNVQEQFETILSDLSRLGLQHNDLKVTDLLVSGDMLRLIDCGFASVEGDMAFGRPEYLDWRPKPNSVVPDSEAMHRLRGLWELADFLHGARNESDGKLEEIEVDSERTEAALYSHPTRRVGSQRETPSVTFSGLSISVRGYQAFDLTKKTLTGSPKVDLVKRILAPFLDDKKSVSAIDIGGSTGHLLIALAVGFPDKQISKTLLEHDRDCVEVVLRVKALTLGFGHMWERLADIEVIQKRLTEPNDGSVPRKDIVTALALVHWLYSCTAHFGSLDAVIAALASFGKPGGMLLVEWVDPQDAAIQEFRHTLFNEDVHQSPYNRQEFEAALDRYCAKYQESGYTKQANTRVLFRCILK